MPRSAVPLCCALLAAPWLGLPHAAQAQGPRTSLPRTVASPLLAVRPAYARATSLPDSVLASRGSYWKEGLVVGAALGALLGQRLLGPFCATSEPAGNACVLPDMAGYAVVAGTGGLVGALLGRAVRKAPREGTPAR
jgi:hypothetical protein